MKVSADNKRFYSGQADALPVIDWLNSNVGSRAGRRFATLVHDLVSLYGGFRRHVSQFPPPEELARIKRTQNGLSRYAFRPFLHPPITRILFGGRSAGRILSSTPFVEWLPSRLLTMRQRITMEDIEGKGQDQEAFNVMHLVRLSQAGLVDKVCQCMCGKWFFPKKRVQETCSRPCYLKKHWATPEYKRKHREDARKRYQDEIADSRPDR